MATWNSPSQASLRATVASSSSAVQSRSTAVSISALRCTKAVAAGATDATAPPARNIFQTALSCARPLAQKIKNRARTFRRNGFEGIARALMCELVVLILGENSLRIPIGKGADDLLAGSTDLIKRCK